MNMLCPGVRHNHYAVHFFEGKPICHHEKEIIKNSKIHPPVMKNDKLTIVKTSTECILTIVYDDNNKCQSRSCVTIVIRILWILYGCMCDKNLSVWKISRITYNYTVVCMQICCVSSSSRLPLDEVHQFPISVLVIRTTTDITLQCSILKTTVVAGH